MKEIPRQDLIASAQRAAKVESIALEIGAKILSRHLKKVTRKLMKVARAARDADAH